MEIRSINPASAKWRALKLAALEPLSDWLQRKSDYLAVVYFAALGLFAQWWAANAMDTSHHTSNLHAALALTALVLMLFSALASFTIYLIRKEVLRRMEF